MDSDRPANYPYLLLCEPRTHTAKTQLGKPMLLP